MNRKYIKTGILSFCTVMMLCMNMGSNAELSEGAGVVYTVIEELRLSVKLDFTTMTIMFAAFYYIKMRIDEKIAWSDSRLYIFDFILSCLWLVSEGFNIDNTLTCLYNYEGGGYQVFNLCGRCV